MTDKELWQEFCEQHHLENGKYEAWAFGGDPKGLAQLVLDGIKTATCSLKLWYDLEEEEIPQENEYSVILNDQNEAVCVIQTTKVSLIPYDKVTVDHALKEGERDRTLESWRAIHHDFFTLECAAAGIIFKEDMELVCEEFKVVYKK